VGSPAAGGRRVGVPGRAARGDGPEADATALEAAALTHPDPAERARALSRLSDTGEDERARDAALSVLDRDQDPEVLREALAVLESSDSVPVDRVMRFASSAQQPDLRLQALELLTEHGGNSAAVRRFVQGLTRDGNAEIRERAQEILEELDDSQQ
jgi:HEAT repeat protein